MVITAYAKINLGLRVLGKREDGFHDIETIFHRIDLHDELNIDATDSIISVSADTAALPADERNLCWKAVELLRTETGTPRGAAIRLRKNIPIGAGLGGGSSDAAAVLTALPKVWNLSVDASTLAAVALNVGSDVPYFLHNKSAYAESRGERLKFVTIPLPFFIVVVTPDIHISTSWAYGELSKQRRDTSQRSKLYDGATCTVATLPDLMKNDFEAIVFEAHPEIAEIKRELLSHGATHALMSGSGSSVFGLFSAENDARRAADYFKSKYFVSMTAPNFIPSL